MGNKRHLHRGDPQVSFLVPFRADNAAPHRVRVWDWLTDYWSWELPDAEIVVGKCKGKVFSKTEAVNDAASRAKGRIFVILDSDVYIRGESIVHCARAIEESQRREDKLWFIPYRHLFRLTEASTEMVLRSDPRTPLRFHSPPNTDEVESTTGSAHGHRFGAMIQIMPREAFATVGGMDPRFAGWGGEDVSFLRAVDTLYAKHKTLDAEVLHLWHANIGSTFQNRMWQGQDKPGSNWNLSSRYGKATQDRAKMRALVDEGCQPGHSRWMRHPLCPLCRMS